METAPLRPRAFLSAFTTLLSIFFFISVHHFSVVYVNSSFLGEFLSPEAVSMVYILSSLLIIGALIIAPRVIAHRGTWFVFILCLPALQIAVFFLGFAESAAAAVFFFIAQACLIFVLRYILDLYLESISKDEAATGNTRSLYITAGNIGVFLGPIIASVVIVGSVFTPLYAFSALLLTPAFFLALGPLRRITPERPREINFRKALAELSCCRRDVRYTMIANFLMHVFNVAIVIYGPLYLFEFGGLSWQAIGSLTALALLPYLFLEIPLGWLADRVTGEKEIMALGLGILAASATLLSFIPLSLFLLWSVFFVATRIGGAMVEISTESYFFKQVTDADVSLISAFRILAPLGGVVAPLIALVALQITSLSYVFAIFGAIFLTGIPFALRIVDTK